MGVFVQTTSLEVWLAPLEVRLAPLDIEYGGGGLFYFYYYFYRFSFSFEIMQLFELLAVLEWRWSFQSCEGSNLQSQIWVLNWSKGCKYDDT